MQKLGCKEEGEEEEEESDKISNPTSNTNKISIKYWKQAMQKLDCKEIKKYSHVLASQSSYILKKN